MKFKKVAVIIMALTLVVGVMGCGKSKESTSTQSSTAEEKSYEIIEANKDNMLKLGAKQSKDLKDLMEKYGVKTAYKSDNDNNAQVTFTKDENEIGNERIGYFITSSGQIKPNYGGDVTYHMSYESDVDKYNDPCYRFTLEMVYPDDNDFKLDDFKMFKDIVQVFLGKDYDMASLESWTQKHIKADEDNTAVITSRDTGSYSEDLVGGAKGSDTGSKKRKLTYSITLRERE